MKEHTVWDIGGEGKQAGESKPHNMDGRMMWAFDLSPIKEFDGYINGTHAIWNGDGQKGAKFANGVDAIWIGSSKPGVGTPGFFLPTADGHACYNCPQCPSPAGVKYGKYDDLHPAIKTIYGQKNFGYNPSVLTGETGFGDLKSEIATTAHTFYEWKFPLSLLGVSADYIAEYGIGVMYKNYKKMVTRLSHHFFIILSYVPFFLSSFACSVRCICLFQLQFLRFLLFLIHNPLNQYALQDY